MRGYDVLAEELLGLDALVLSPGVDLDCSRLNASLAAEVASLRALAVGRMLADFRAYNSKCVAVLHTRILCFCLSVYGLGQHGL